MSTSIVKWDNGQRDFQPEALKVYTYATLSFMIVTFAFWGWMQVIEKRREKLDDQIMKDKKINPEP